MDNILQNKDCHFFEEALIYFDDQFENLNMTFVNNN